jgi:hypothetical protein
MVELELVALATQALNQRIASISQVRDVAWLWKAARNAASTTVNWRFTTPVARQKLKRLYGGS